MPHLFSEYDQTQVKIELALFDLSVTVSRLQDLGTILSSLDIAELAFANSILKEIMTLHLKR